MSPLSSRVVHTLSTRDSHVPLSAADLPPLCQQKDIPRGHSNSPARAPCAFLVTRACGGGSRKVGPVSAHSIKLCSIAGAYSERRRGCYRRLSCELSPEAHRGARLMWKLLYVKTSRHKDAAWLARLVGLPRWCANLLCTLHSPALVFQDSSELSKSTLPLASSRSCELACW